MIDLLYSDMHLREDRLHIFEDVHDKIFEIGKKEGVISSGGFFINGGDTFHVRGIIRTSCFELLCRKRQEWWERGLMNHIDLIGNHDQEDKDGRIHPMKVFDGFQRSSGWKVVDKPTVIKQMGDVFYAFPYMPKLSEEIAKISKSNRKNAIALVHTGVHGAFKNDGELDDFSIHPKIFKGFKRTFSGHYHNRCMYEGLIQYIGSPVQHTFSEMDQEKGVLIYHRETDVLKFVPIDGPKHHSIDVTWIDGNMNIDIPENIDKRDIVRVRLHGSSSEVASVSKSNIKIECDNIRFERKTKDTLSSRIKSENVGIHSLIDMYVDYVDPDLDKKKLMIIGKKLMGDQNANL